MKVLITSDWYITAINGVVTSILTLKKSLEDRGHEVKILTINTAHKSDKKDNDIYALGSISIEKLYPNLRTTARIYSHLVQELIQWNPDIIHSNCEFTTFVIAKHISHKCHTPIVHTYHTVYEDYTHYFSPSKKLGRRMVQDFTRFISKHVESIIAPTNKVAKLLEDYQVECPVNILPTGIELSKFQEEPSEMWIKQIRKNYNIESKQHIVIYLGRLAKEKNIDVLIEMSAFLPEDYVLLIVGGGPDEERLINIKAKLHAENVIFTGMILPEETSNYYHLGEIFVSASTSETQGLTFFEAMASGLPVICIEDDCLKGILINGYNGYMCNNKKEMAEAIFNTISTDCKKLGQNATLTANKYSNEAFGKGAEAIYQKAIEYYTEERQKKIRFRLRKDIVDFAQKLKIAMKI